MRRRAAALLVVLLVIAGVVWWPIAIRPLARGTIVVLDVYSSALWGENAAARITPEPRVTEDRIALAGEDARVTWWTPGWGERHPAMLLVNGATPLGNDDPETRRIAEALARAGYLIMLPQFDFLTGARLEPAAPARVEAAFAALLARPDADPGHAGAFGFSVGGGVMLAAAGRPGAALSHARYLGALGAFFDIDTYLASVVSGHQKRAGRLEAWTPDPEARLKLPRGAAEALADATDRQRLVAAIDASGGAIGDPPAGLGADARALWSALAAPDYDSALARLEALPPSLRATFDALSPSRSWSSVAAPVFWLHDEGDRFEPIAEAEAAAATPRGGETELYETHLLSHAAALSADARARGLDFWAPEIGGLLGFATDVLRRAG